MGRRRNEERWKYWLDVLTEQQSSGLSIARFCRERDLLPTSFYAWRRKLADSVSPVAATPSKFVPLPIGAVSSGFRVRLPNGVRLSVPPQFDAAMLSALLQSASSIGDADA